MESTVIKYLCFVLFECAIFTIGGMLFTTGFLLKRNEVNGTSTCEQTGGKQGKNECFQTTHFKRAVILIIDALRYDFVEPDVRAEKFKSLNAHAYKNQLKSIGSKLKKEPDKSVLFKFLADPPTTTLQRLKGLTTGSLPTFVDAGSNFAGSDITEDSIINQLVKHHKNITFMGDDTWLSLFPNHFFKSYAYPSFNVKDLHTVDDGVESHLFEELKLKDWTVMIGHFLGVDHCGHIYGPNHPIMTKKLMKMDDVLRRVMDQLEEDTVLFVLGDHGMTSTGDHGGDSKDELEAALFVYSPTPIIDSKAKYKSSDNTVSQIDLVPTLALLLEIPIPFSNLGTIIPELFTSCPLCTTEVVTSLHVLKALQVNTNQVRRYILEYSKSSSDFSHRTMDELEAIFTANKKMSEKVLTYNKDVTESNKEFQEKVDVIISNHMNYLKRIKEMCIDIWAKFDLISMMTGVMCFIISFAFILTIKDPTTLNGLTCMGMSLNIVVIPVLAVLSFKNMVTTEIMYLCSSLMLFPIASYLLFISMQDLTASKSASWFNLNSQINLSSVSFLVFIIYTIGMYSNSYVVYEDRVTSYLLQTIVWLIFYKINIHLQQVSSKKQQQSSLLLGKGMDKKYKSTASGKGSRHKSENFDVFRVLTSARMLAFILALSLCAIIRLAVFFRSCREEQVGCENSVFTQSLTAITDNFRAYKNFRFFFSVGAMIYIPVVVYKWTRYHGNLNGETIGSFIVKYFLPFACMCVAFHWAIQACPQNIKDKLTPWQQTFFAKTTYVTILISMFLLLCKPLCVFLIPSVKNVNNWTFTKQDDSNLVPKMYNHIRMNWQKYLTGDCGNKNSTKSEASEESAPVVYGLGTAYSAAALIMVALVLVLLILLLGDGMSLGLILQFTAMLIFLEIHSCLMLLENNQQGSQSGVPLYSIIWWCLLCSHFFFATGHHATIPAIRFEAAYVGFTGDHFFYVIPVVLISLNTFASHVVGILALPLLIFWPYYRGTSIFYFEKEKAAVNQKGELLLYENSKYFQKSLFQLFASYLLLAAIKFFITMTAAAIHRRHLMVWKIFAPRFIFEGATFIASSVTVIFVYFIVLRVNHVLTKWLEKLK